MPNFTLIDGQIKADVWTNGSATSVKAIVHPQYQPEADGFMKLDDIKGELTIAKPVAFSLVNTPVRSSPSGRQNVGTFSALQTETPRGKKVML